MFSLFNPNSQTCIYLLLPISPPDKAYTVHAGHENGEHDHKRWNLIADVYTNSPDLWHKKHIEDREESMHIDVAAYKSNNKSDTDTDRGSSFLFLRPWHKKHNMQHNQSKLNGRHVWEHLERKRVCSFNLCTWKLIYERATQIQTAKHLWIILLLKISIRTCSFCF